MGASHQVVLVARSMSSGVLRLKGTSQFRQSIACATLTGRTVIIDDIRTDDEEPGRDFEASFLRLMEKGVVPEDVGKSTALLLCEEVLKGGCVDTAHQSFAFLMMVLCPEDVGKIRIGKLSAHSVRFLQHLRLFFGITFKIVPDVETRTVLLSCRGIGFKNTSRRTS